jgi:hypothetical protein
MNRLVPTAAALVLSLASPMLGQTPAPTPAPTKQTTNQVLTISGCVSPAQRDGSLAAKAGATATPDTAPNEANSLEPTGQYLLLDATQKSAGKGAAAEPSSLPAHPTSYALSGHESDLAKFNARRVEIVGSIVPTVGAGLGGRGADAADGIQRVRVTSIKRIAGSCSAKKN